MIKHTQFQIRQLGRGTKIDDFRSDGSNSIFHSNEYTEFGVEMMLHQLFLKNPNNVYVVIPFVFYTA